jgi:hypothetical protein
MPDPSVPLTKSPPSEIPSKLHIKTNTSPLHRYKARRASLRELRSHSPHALELEYQKLRQPGPPLYEEIMVGWSAEEARTDGDAQRRATSEDASAGAGAGTSAVVVARDPEQRRLRKAQRPEGAQIAR